MVRFFGAKGGRLFARRVDAVASTTVRVRITARDPKSGNTTELFLDATSDNDRVTDVFNSADTLRTDAEIVGLTAVVTTAGTVKRGQFYMDVSIGAGVVESIPIASGYVYDGHALSLGDFVEPGPAGGQGNIRVISTANPAAAAEVARTAVDTNALWRPLAFSVTMAQGITQTPHPALLITDSAPNTLARVPIGADVAASTTVRCTWQRGTDTRNNVTSGEMVASMPDMLLPEAFGLETLTEGIGANSDYGVAIITVEEWLVI